MIGVIGLDHNRAGVRLRGCVTFAAEGLMEALRRLAAEQVIDEVVILSTCNRTEVYVASPAWEEAACHVRRFLRAAATRVAGDAPAAVGDGQTEELTAVGSDAPLNAIEAELERALYMVEEGEAARHLFRVSAGLRSMVFGEAQILGQVKDALHQAEVARSVGEELRSLFTIAVKVGKRARTETEIGRADVSVAGVALRAATEELGGLAGRTALLIGAGRTAQLAAALLREQGTRRLILANRTVAAAEALARETGGEAITLEAIGAALPAVDLALSATAAPHTVLSAAMVAPALAERAAGRRPLVIVDLAAPPDVEAEVGALPGVRLLTLDTLHGRADEQADGGAERRAVAVEQVEALVGEGAREFARARSLRLVAPSIAALRRHVDNSEQAELARALAHLEHLSPADRAVVERFGQRLVDKMFFHLVSRIRALAEDEETTLESATQLLARLFADPSGT